MTALIERTSSHNRYSSCSYAMLNTVTPPCMQAPIKTDKRVLKVLRASPSIK